MEIEFKQIVIYYHEDISAPLTEDQRTIVIVPKQGLPKAKVQFNELSSFTTAWRNGSYYTADIVATFGTTLDDSSFLIASPPVERAINDLTNEVFSQNKTHVENQVADAIAAEKLSKEKLKAQSLQHLGIPVIPDDLYIDPSVWSLLCTTIQLDKYPLLLGPKGCGKTETAYRLAEAHGAAFYPCNAGAAFKPKQFFVGMMHLKENENGSTETILIESEFLKAFKSEEPMYIFLDEITRVPQQAENYLMTILDKKQSYIYVEELGMRIYRGKGVRFIAAGNVGMQYAGTRTLDGAFADRWQKFLVDYLPSDKEFALCRKRAPLATAGDVTTLIAWANLIRAEEKTENISTGFSTRQVIDMAHYLEKGFLLNDIKENLLLTNFINGNNEIEQVKALLQQV